jgi:hypothetical protein
MGTGEEGKKRGAFTSLLFFLIRAAFSYTIPIGSLLASVSPPPLTVVTV